MEWMVPLYQVSLFVSLPLWLNIRLQLSGQLHMVQAICSSILIKQNNIISISVIMLRKPFLSSFYDLDEIQNVCTLYYVIEIDG
ncbi:hypothetical protein RhiirC2_735783 [Rhizophagus irregularis]|uniref:Uncharacterized protein n=1 Tax=Rhizophagus irregularis TaxID=588596 RepID=A0A2N1NPN3_9GLOM|nr:hypothetical protein RhiirC2_735783 [Rhizophagus irregularis]